MECKIGIDRIENWKQLILRNHERIRIGKKNRFAKRDRTAKKCTHVANVVFEFIDGFNAEFSVAIKTAKRTMIVQSNLQSLGGRARGIGRAGEC